MFIKKGISKNLNETCGVAIFGLFNVPNLAHLTRKTKIALKSFCEDTKSVKTKSHPNFSYTRSLN